MEYRLKSEEEIRPVEVDVTDDDLITAAIDGNVYRIKYLTLSDHKIHLTVNGRSFNVYLAEGPDGKTVLIDGTVYLLQDADLLEQKSTKKRGRGNTPTEITPVTPSVVVSILVSEGEFVEQGQGVVVLSAMKMEITLNAPYSGKVIAINAAEGDKVSPGQILVEIDKPDSDNAVDN